MNRKVILTLIKSVILLHLFVAIPADFILAITNERDGFTLCHFSPSARGCSNYWIRILWIDVVPIVIFISGLILYLFRQRDGDS